MQVGRERTWGPVTSGDALLPCEVYQRSASKHAPSAPVPVQSMIRFAQLEHVEHCIQMVEATEQWIPFRHRWLTV